MSLNAGDESIGDSRTGSTAPVEVPIHFLTLAALLLTVVFSMAGPPPAASAAEYSVWSCRGPDGSALSAEAWRLRTWNAGPADFASHDGCIAGGALEAESVVTGLGARSQAWATFDLPRGDVISGYTLWRYLFAPVTFGGSYVSAVRETSGGSTFDDGCASVLMIPDFTCSSSGSPSDPLDPGNEVARSGVPLDGLDLYTGCVSNSCPATAPSTGSVFRLYRSVVRIEDNFAPSVGAVDGTIAGSAPVSGRASVTVTGSDAGSGLAEVSLSLDGTPAASGPPDGSPATCSLPYTVARPCLSGGSRTFTFDTGTMSPGTHSASGTITDAAGNTTSWGPIYFQVADPVVPAPVPDNGNPATVSPRLKVDRKVVDHRAGRTAIISGRLTTETGVPVAGARLTARLAPLAANDRTERRLPDAMTATDGRFRIPVKGAGARQISVSYSPILGGPPVASVSATARARVTLHLKRRPARVKRGQKVTFRGGLAGGGPSAGGANVEIQAIVSGRWRAIANVKARRNGTFAWPYRFRYVERDAIFSFRAVVRRTLGWPWPTLRSKRVRVRVNGAG